MSEMLSREALLALVNAASQGKRPYFFDDPDIDRLLSIVWALAGELAVTRERLDTLERVLASKALIESTSIDQYRPDADAAQERGQWQIEYIGRLLRLLEQEADAMKRR